MNSITRCACYVRVSTDNQLENYSIEEQTDRLKAYCKAKDYTIAKIYTDGGYSGGNTNRPALQQMLSDIKTGSINTVIVYKLDRLSRSQKDTLMLIEDQFLTNSVDFVSVNENFDTSTPFGRAMIGILSVFAQLEKDQITERFTMGRIGRAKNGYFHGGGNAPVGYNYIDGELIVNDYEALQIGILFVRCRRGYSVFNCYRFMLQNKYTTKYGGWTETLVRKVLTNRLYIGEVQYNGIHYKGRHSPIIQTELFFAVQELLNGSKRKLPSYLRYPYKANTLLSGMIYCGECGARFHGEHGNYSCYSRTKGNVKYIVDPNCKNKKWKIDELDNLVIDFIVKFNFEEGENKGAQDSENIQSNKNYDKRITEIDKQISKLIDLYQIGGIPLETISTKIDSLTTEKEALTSQATADTSTKATQQEMIEFRNRFLSLLDRGDLMEKRASLATLIDRITITEEDVEITIK